MRVTGHERLQAISITRRSLKTKCDKIRAGNSFRHWYWPVAKDGRKNCWKFLRQEKGIHVKTHFLVFKHQRAMCDTCICCNYFARLFPSKHNGSILPGYTCFLFSKTYQISPPTTALDFRRGLHYGSRLVPFKNSLLKLPPTYLWCAFFGLLNPQYATDSQATLSGSSNRIPSAVSEFGVNITSLTWSTFSFKEWLALFGEIFTALSSAWLVWQEGYSPHLWITSSTCT